MTIKENVKAIIVKLKSAAINTIKQFKSFNYKALKSKEGWISFLKNKTMLITSLVAITVIIVIPVSIAANNNSSSVDNQAVNNSSSSVDNQKIYETLFNCNTAGGKLGTAVSKIISANDISITQDETGVYLVTITGSPYSYQYAGLDAYDTVSVTYSVNLEAGLCSFVSFNGTTEFGQTFDIGFSAWNTYLLASLYN